MSLPHGMLHFDGSDGHPLLVVLAELVYQCVMDASLILCFCLRTEPLFRDDSAVWLNSGTMCACVC